MFHSPGPVLIKFGYRMKKIFPVMFLSIIAQFAHAETYDDCILTKMVGADNEDQVQTIKQNCQDLIEEDKEEGVTSGAFTKRLLDERETEWNRHSLTAHKQNYILPFTHSSRVTCEAYAASGDWSDDLKHYEAKFQISVKVPLTAKPLLTESDSIHVGFTLESWWQLYAGDISAPFRETNYQPEKMIWYLARKRYCLRLLLVI